LRTDAITAPYSAALAGAGIAAFTRQTVQTDIGSGRLFQVLPEHTLGSRHYYALYPQTRHVRPKVRAFVDHMAEHYRGQ
jgi:DNA-binding transcriptional LysR family regulator